MVLLATPNTAVDWRALRDELWAILETERSGCWIVKFDDGDALIVVDCGPQRLRVACPIASLNDVSGDVLKRFAGAGHKTGPCCAIDGGWLWAQEIGPVHGLIADDLLDGLQRVRELRDVVRQELCGTL